MLYEYNIRTNDRNQILDITPMVREAVRKSGVKNGIVVVYTPHTTAGITINENADPDVKTDITEFLKELIPYNWRYLHGEGNSDSHIKSTLVAPTINLIVDNGDVKLGTWQGILFCEFDGPRSRKIWVKVLEG